jgi:hypothetical protein
MDYFKMFQFDLVYNLFTVYGGIYFVWILFHFVASHLYIYMCVPGTLYGFLIAPFMASTPQCYALRWTIYNGGNSISAMWLIAGLWVMKFLIPVLRPNNVQYAN